MIDNTRGCITEHCTYRVCITGHPSKVTNLHGTPGLSAFRAFGSRTHTTGTTRTRCMMHGHRCLSSIAALHASPTRSQRPSMPHPAYPSVPAPWHHAQSRASAMISWIDRSPTLRRLTTHASRQSVCARMHTPAGTCTAAQTFRSSSSFDSIVCVSRVESRFVRVQIRLPGAILGTEDE